MIRVQVDTQRLHWICTRCTGNQHKVLACAYRVDSNQSAYLHRLIRVVSFPPEDTLDPWLPIEGPSWTLMRGSRKFCHRGFNLDRVFYFLFFS